MVPSHAQHRGPLLHGRTQDSSGLAVDPLWLGLLRVSGSPGVAGGLRAAKKTVVWPLGISGEEGGTSGEKPIEEEPQIERGSTSGCP